MAEKCNGCGAEIAYLAGSQSLKCPYCGAENKIEKAEERLPDEVDKIIPLTVSQDDLEKRAYGHMASGTYTPDDMLEAATFTKRECFYVPAFLFQVEYEATWTASFGYNRREPYTDYKTVVENGRSHRVPYTAYRTVTDWRPANGVDAGILSVSTYAGKALNGEALSPSGIIPATIANGSITDFNPSFVKGVQAEGFAVPEASAFSSLEREINSEIDHNVQRHAQGDRQRDWHWQARMSHATKTVYVPICHAVFDYKGSEYHYWMDGVGRSESRVSKLPEDQDRKSLVSLGFIPAAVSTIGLLLTFAFWPFNWTGLVAGLVAASLAWIYAGMRRSSILTHSKGLRDALLAQIHASSSATEVLSSEERERRAKAFQRPEKRLLARTDRDRVMLPVLSVTALLLVMIASFLGGGNTLRSATFAQISSSPSRGSVPATSAQGQPEPSERPAPAAPSPAVTAVPEGKQTATAASPPEAAQERNPPAEAPVPTSEKPVARAYDKPRVEEVLSSESATPPHEISSSSPPTSGVLRYSGPPVSHGGTIVFPNLPGGRLRFTFDQQAWQPLISRQADGTQKLTLRSLQSQDQSECEVRWELVQ